ncbi:sigma-54-dependent transcriptional regulator [Nitrospira moscoviensis]|uniref:Sigma-54 dependent transcriptional regulator n=1 Tax=Nitrospira moscoviensis TaxID=42253 RepID=A0A0K2GHD4_NITMO|nr:sigma-54 dependent transcriptional regulator [Nitrospira moscoviensis]ALA60022.1 Sigma-54 dependent transcriptional regulator [Nitrospira moscoviensis]
MTALKILIVDDEPLMRLSMADALEAVGHDVHAAATGTEGVELVGKRAFDLVITDLRLPGADGLTVLKATKDHHPQAEVVVITAHGSVETAVGAMKLGAFDYITKPFQMDELLLIVERAGTVVTLRKENQDLKEALEDKFSFGGILGANTRMRAVLDKIKLVAATDSTVLILGESGTGKELAANAVHQNSPRRDYPLIKVSCAALPETLLEAELFGHEKGAFTGALRQRRGRFEMANRGTLFLDEIGEISPIVQVKLLRVLQERKFERVGSNQTIEVDVRLVCATQKDLRKEVAAGRFREDLFYRLNVVQIVIPPLRERQEDIMVIAEHVLQSCAGKLHKHLKGFSQPARELLLRYSYPGNVRELENMIERAVALGREREAVQPQDLCGFQTCPYLGGPPQDSCGFCSEGLTAGSKKKDAPLTSLSTAREGFEKDYIVSVLERVEGNRTTASKILGLSRKALWEKCKRYGIPSARDEGEEAAE